MTFHSPTLAKRHLETLWAPDEVIARFTAIEHMIGSEYMPRFIAFRAEVMALLKQHPDVAHDTGVIDATTAEIERVGTTMAWHPSLKTARIRWAMRQASNDNTAKNIAA
jgi:hypothetical protein